MKNVHVYDILAENGQSFVDLIIPVEDNFTYMDVFDKVQIAYADEVDSYSYSVVE